MHGVRSESESDSQYGSGSTYRSDKGHVLIFKVSHGQISSLRSKSDCESGQIQGQRQVHRIHRIHRNHHSPEDSDGVSRHRLVPISPTFYISHF